MSKEKIGEVLFLSKSDTESALTPKELINICNQVFKWIGEGKVKHEHSAIHFSLLERGFVYLALVEPLYVVGYKFIYWSQNAVNRGLPLIQGLVGIADSVTGMPYAIMDGGSVTALRTAGHAAVGASYLARKDSSTVAVIGCGVEGRSHLTLLNEIFSLEEVRAFDINREILDRYVEEMREKLNLEVKHFNNAREAVRGADIICMCTTATQPVVMDEWIEPGCHVCGTHMFGDLDPKFSKTADKWVIGNWQCDSEWVNKMIAWNLSIYDIYSDMSEIVIGKRTGRERDDERTVMTHGGMAPLDVSTGYYVYQAAKKKGLGYMVKLF